VEGDGGYHALIGFSINQCVAGIVVG
jgi:hypothetical protein